VLLSAAVLGLAGCVNAEKSAPAGAGDSVSYGNPPSTQPAATTTQPGSPASGSPSTSPSAGGGTNQTADPHNDADATFAKNAALLRQQALTIAGWAQTSSSNSQFKAVASKIAQDKTPDVTQLTGWLSQWNQPAPTGQVDGMLSASDLNQLHTATGTPFDMHFAQAVKNNLTAAKQAATTEQAQGSNPQAKQVAQQWIGELTTELAQVKSATG
jgi:uncharacterized protein (DUF305 family)